MTYTLTDYIRGFHKFNRAKCFSSSVQSTFLAIVCEFDAQGFPDEIELSTRELQLRSGLKSVATVHEAKNVLKMNRLIDFRTRKKQQTTFFTLCTGHLSECSAGRSTERSTEHSTEQGSEHSTEHLTEQCGLVCYTPAQVQDGGGGGETLPLPPTPPNPNPIKTAEAKAQLSKAEQSNAGAEIDIVKVWEEMTGKPLVDAASQFLLRRAEDLHGREMVKVAIAEYVRGKGKLFKYFEVILKSLASRLADLRGSEEDGRDSQGVRMDRRTGGSGRNIQSFAQTASGGDDEELPDETDYERIYADIAALQNSNSSD